MSSLRRRLQLGLAASVLVLLPLAIWGGGAAVRGLVREYALDRLAHDAEALLGAVRLDASGRLTLPEAALAPVYRQPFSGHYYVLLDAGGAAQRSRSLWDRHLAVAPLAPGAQRVVETGGPQQQSLVLLAAGYRKQEQDLTIAVAEDLGPIEQTVRRFQLASAAGVLAMLAGLLLVQRVVVRRSLRSLDALRTDVRRVERGEASGLREDVPAEVLPLAREVNRLLALLDQRLQRSRNAVGNLAHALKTPLTLLVQQIDGEALRAHPEARQTLRQQVERISELMERELRRARLAGSGAVGRHFRAARDVPPLVDALRQMHGRDDLHIEIKALPSATVALDDEDVIELLGNLLDNACKWAESTVWLRLTIDGALKIHVDDDGPGLRTEDAGDLLKRGRRLDESRPGHGLGLGIVQDIVTLYGGTLELARSADLGGLRVAATLPLHEAA